MSGHEDIPHPTLESGLPQGEKPGGFGRGQPGLESWVGITVGKSHLVWVSVSPAVMRMDTGGKNSSTDCP